MLWSIIVGGFIGFVAGRITKKAQSMGIILRVIAGLVGLRRSSFAWYLGIQVLQAWH